MMFHIIIVFLTFGYMNLQALDSSSEEDDDSPENTTQRIVGGYNVDIEDFPWQVSISYKGAHNCGGSILNRYYILTAAHCTYGLSISKMKVRVGSSYRIKGGNVYDVSSKYEHPKYNEDDFEHDFCILRLNKELEFTDKVKPVELPEQDSPDPEPGTIATVSGFGQLSENEKVMSTRLMAVDVPIISRETCQKRYRKYPIDESMICALYPEGGKDACAGDSGGPLTVGDVQIGVVSWGIGCGSKKFPGVYASVKNALTFISTSAKI